MKNHSVDTLESCRDHADTIGVNYLDLIATESPNLLKNNNVWPDVINYGTDFGLAMMNVDLVDNKYNDFLTEFSRNIGDVIKFPPSTIFMHALGVIASAMTKSFSVQYYGKSKTSVSLYVVTAQPPSTGKSGVNNILTNPVHEAFGRLNEDTDYEREILQEDLADALKQYDSKKDSMDKNQRKNEKIYIKDIEDKIAKNPKYRYALDDTTIEAAESVASKQGGLFNIISAEAESINVVVGAVYGDKSSKSNIGLILKGWDNERFSSARMSREGFDGFVRGSIAVLAQYESVDTILSSSGGRGLAERFLLFSEKNYLGSRNHTIINSLSPILESKYKMLIENLVRADDTIFTVDDAGEKALALFRNKIEPEMRNGGDYSGNMITGFVGKADKQILKIAAVLHACEHWADNKDLNTEIKFTTITRAQSIFHKLITAYISVSDSMGHAGKTSEINKSIEKLAEFKLKTNCITLRAFVNSVKNVKPFVDSRKEGFTAYIKDKVLSVLVENHYCHIHNNKIYINPNL